MDFLKISLYFLGWWDHNEPRNQTKEIHMCDSYPIEPYVVLNDDPEYGDMMWYAVDQWGATAGPFKTKEAAEEKLQQLK